MQWILAERREILLTKSNVKLVVGPSEVLYAAGLAEDMPDTDLSKCYGLF
jgi:hypothetical protein